MASVAPAACSHNRQSCSLREGCRSMCRARSSTCCNGNGPWRRDGAHTGVSCSSNSLRTRSPWFGASPYTTAASKPSRRKSTPCCTVVVSSTGTSGRSACHSIRRGNSQRITQVGALSCKVVLRPPTSRTPCSISANTCCTLGSQSWPSRVRLSPRAWRWNKA